MASNPVAICNQALSWLSEDPITDLNEGSKEAQLCKSNYGPLRDSILSTGEFAFARKYKTFSVHSGDSPDWGWKYAFDIPTEFLAVLEAYSPSNVFLATWTRRKEVEYEQVGNQIFANDPVIDVVLAERITDTTKFSPLFIQAFAARIAAEIALPLTENRSLQGAMWSLYNDKINEAAARDKAMKRHNPQTPRLINIRNGNGGYHQ